jgi:hypothetical protein
VLAVDFGDSGQKRQSFMDRFHRHGHVDLPDMVALMGRAGLTIVETGAVGFKDLQYVLATSDGSGP